ncbi:50S ribosomal protein L4 [Enterobacteriaceae endosymbiont of Plateumaris consimilis]|uniref:50S ribosomal protein L4 n=1 Tax=Enterobacteriaceae endosymbiont of Plateumaris consimilis TaxID=2675794 RepID=UPI001449A065|nr:50S ribosomal protein L4 [Enterobacteriaceae endosymbiont of Plateumaris consimilis]QJC28688.1 50S ribosomal protein L4 [Enterobacteriaceae endosymbiont of Plateumaris consimilis]
MEIITKDTKNKVILSDNIFNKHYNKPLIHQVLESYRTMSRQGTKAQKTRGEVKGSGKKPWRQKGTGKARAGSTQSPIWRSGGVTFASKNKIYYKKINKKMYRNALKSIFSELLRKDRIILLSDLIIEKPKTKILIDKLKNFIFKKAIIITIYIDNNLSLASRNLYNIQIKNSMNIDPISLINSDKVIITINAIKHIEEILT